ncbi:MULTISPECIES: amino acid ABC transporter permease [unclassified Amycolatopsis]|uniref:amino acid ABC transporter permease n=1 Tax=unclassified Amycolatopsis TaxID=2618356 RepID=UPI002874E1A1|nr:MULTISPECIES: amino acid ABC transporter permease [unclassified Amycolatopsis]MDS0135967.1 amino acid ABC transporter permease [Amycolatopsis sp. 505]MDS0145444.1 amino acid ABC transporter permease [Amycolatopsis sp. CM201R]
MTSDLRTRPASAAAPEETLRIVPARHPLTWIAAAVVAVLVAMAGHALITNKAFDWPTFTRFVFQKSILEAVALTLELTLFGVVAGFLLGTVLALMRISRNPLLRAVSWTYTWIFRSVPLILQLLFWYNLAILYNEVSFGIPFGPSFVSVGTMSLIPPFLAAGLGLALHQGAYAAEIVRAGFLSVDAGQREAAAALGIPAGRQFRRIVLPQAMRTIVPTAANEIIGLLKATSQVYVMALPELFYQVQVIYTRSGRVIPLLLVATAWYLALTTVLSVAQFSVERHFGRGTQRTLPPTPLQRLRAAWRRA